MFHVLKKLIKDKKGISPFLSSAAMIPIVFMLFAVFLQFTLIGTAQLAVNEAAFEAARSAARSSTPQQTAVQTAQNFANGFLIGWAKNITVTVNMPDTNPGSPVTVQVAYPVPRLFSLFQTTTVYGASTQVLEDVP